MSLEGLVRLAIVGAGAALAASTLFSRKSWAMELQPSFEDFHGRIKLDEVDEKRKLVEKREVLLRELRDKLPSDTPTFSSFNQGSYSMHTGVAPLDGNYDIDVGVVFDCRKNEYPDPVVLKSMVRDALQSGNRTVEIRRPCVTVTYLRQGAPEYHVDLVLYARRDDDKFDLAKGKEHSTQSKRVWEVSEPRKLTELVTTRFRNAGDQAQYRRCIRYLKRWRDQQFTKGAPVSIGLTLAAYHWFGPSKSFWNDDYRDITALREWVETILEHFEGAGERSRRLQILLPVAPGTDVLSDMTALQMASMEKKLRILVAELNAAEEADSLEQASQILAGQFGKDFPVLVGSAG